MRFLPFVVKKHLLISCLLTVVGCATAEPTAVVSPPKVKNIILFIGDGMGPQEVGLLLSYKKEILHEESNVEKLLKDGYLSLAQVAPHQYLVTDSAAAATALACGVKTRPGMIGVGPQGDKLETILEKAESRGKWTGLISTTRMTHATPAAFVAHQLSRDMENEIASDIVNHEVEVLLSGGVRHWIPEGWSTEELARFQDSKIGGFSKRKDKRNLLEEAMWKGYTFVSNADELDRAADKPKLLGLFSSSSFPYAIDRDDESLGVPTLPQMTDKALDILSQSPQGFFLMVEAGEIDYAAHDNDAGALLHELLEMDETLGLVLKFVKKNEETLLIWTADHETGGFSFAYHKTKGPISVKLKTGGTYDPVYNFGNVEALKKLAEQKKSLGVMLEDVKNDPRKLVTEIKESAGFSLTLEQAKEILKVDPVTGVPGTKDFHDFYVYPESVRQALLARALSSQTGIVWSTGTHTSTPVLVGTYGVSAENFRGVLENTDIFHQAAKYLH